MKRDLELLFEIGTLKNIERGWRQHLAMECANNLEHSFRMAFIALMLARKETEKTGVKLDEGKILKMALVHDLAEARTADLSYVQKVYTKADEQSAARDMFDGTSFPDFYAEIFEEYEKRESPESKIVKDADNLDVDIELRELEERGSQLPKKWAKTRQLIHDEKLYTESAKELWREIQTADPSSWHLLANKWYKIPSAGK